MITLVSLEIASIILLLGAQVIAEFERRGVDDYSDTEGLGT